MTDPAQGTAAPEGQATSAPTQPTSAPAPAPAASGQPQGDQRTTGATGPSGDDVLFDPAEYESLTKELPEPLKKQAEALKKSLQSAFTKKTQAIASDRKKIEAFDSIQRDPHRAVQQFANQLGYKLTPAQQAAAVQAATGEGWAPDKGDPNSWNDVVGFMVNKLREEMGGRLQPIVQEFHSLKKQTIEQTLSEIDPSWHQYEDAMAANLQKHPTLAADPSMLYRLSVPAEVFESRATQKALAKLKSKTDSATVQGASTTNRKPPTPHGKLTFQQAVEAARQELSERGVQ